jgi:hypothetical protein
MEPLWLDAIRDRHSGKSNFARPASYPQLSAGCCEWPTTEGYPSSPGYVKHPNKVVKFLILSPFNQIVKHFLPHRLSALSLP